MSKTLFGKLLIFLLEFVLANNSCHSLNIVRDSFSSFTHIKRSVLTNPKRGEFLFPPFYSQKWVEGHSVSCLGLSDELLREFCPGAPAPYICDRFFSCSEDDFLILLLMLNTSMMVAVSAGSSQDLNIIRKKKQRPLQIRFAAWPP